MPEHPVDCSADRMNETAPLNRTAVLGWSGLTVRQGVEAVFVSRRAAPASGHGVAAHSSGLGADMHIMFMLWRRPWISRCPICIAAVPYDCAARVGPDANQTAHLVLPELHRDHLFQRIALVCLDVRRCKV